MGEISIKLWDGTTKKFKQGVPVVILGANGSGKTRLGVKLEELNDKSFSNTADTDLLIQRISAQKSLTIPNDMILKGLEASKKDAYIGSSSSDTNKQVYRYELNPSTHLLQDYDKILSLFFAKNNKQLEDAHRDGVNTPFKTLTEQAEEIWGFLLPQRKLDLIGNEVHVKMNEQRYHGKEMSDGERVILYMIVQALALTENSVLIIDEPELHIHKAIVNKLWDKLEAIRQDCVFIYITHDLDFAVSRNTDEVLWVKHFDGNSTWDAEFIKIDDYSELPPELLFEIIGTQKKILFVEGTKSSLDYLLYRELYKDKNYHVIPCGGCQEVINFVRAKKGYDKFNAISVYGVIDRDFREEPEIQGLATDNIFCLKVAEVENLFVVPELLEVIRDQMGCNESVLQDAKDFIVRCFNAQKSKQINTAFIKEMDWQTTLQRFDGIDANAESILSAINDKFTLDFIEEILQTSSERFNSATTIPDILKIFNYKTLSSSIGNCFGIKDKDTPYPKRVINILKTGVKEIRERIITAVKPYLPELP